MKKKHLSKQKLVVVAQPRPARFRRNAPVVLTKSETQALKGNATHERQAS